MTLGECRDELERMPYGVMGPVGPARIYIVQTARPAPASSQRRQPRCGARRDPDPRTHCRGRLPCEICVAAYGPAMPKLAAPRPARRWWEPWR
jgi:hypothetical protein